MRKSAPIVIILYTPKTEAGQRELAQRVSAVHADFVSAQIQKLNCPAVQKVKMLNSVISAIPDMSSRSK